LLTKETQKIILTYKRPLSCFFEINFPLILFFFCEFPYLVHENHWNVNETTFL
jgi:hypothetical protein